MVASMPCPESVLRGHLSSWDPPVLWKRSDAVWVRLGLCLTGPVVSLEAATFKEAVSVRPLSVRGPKLLARGSPRPCYSHARVVLVLYITKLESGACPPLMGWPAQGPGWPAGTVAPTGLPQSALP
jgi:hypothetical protein